MQYIPTLVLIVEVYALAVVVGLVYRYVLKKFAANSVRGVSRNIDTSGRVIRFVIGVVLLILAAVTEWNPVLLFFSGFCLFEAAFSWCGLYAALGKNSCPM